MLITALEVIYDEHEERKMEEGRQIVRGRGRKRAAKWSGIPRGASTRTTLGIWYWTGYCHLLLLSTAEEIICVCVRGGESD